ncbi:unnamed protein product [Caenorhabditis auriculariae]|uniref:Geranylgeranyl pyrophosphate synthase n=1 Tax=Caenorhabditis auriculariae TaxID=2777116 RepID=A0A8S1HCA9_9PELO|nr:unnamed protein product [Caenorhabditis auriculariae]
MDYTNGGGDSVPPGATTSSAGEDDHLLAPFEYIRSMPGKQIRSKLAIAFNLWLRIEESKLHQILEIVEMLHNASLLIDDIEDNSVLRRGLPVTHRIFGTPRTINSANYVYFIALEKCIGLGSDQAIRVFTEQLLELHRGQGKELFWRDTVSCPTEAQYEDMVVQKTGGLFFLAVRLMQGFSENVHGFERLLRLMALFFQIRDDYLNLVSDEMAQQKTFAEDLTEGKFSFPIIHAVHNFSGSRNDDPVINILRQRTQDVEVKRFCILLLQKRGSFQHTVTRLQQLSNELKAEVEALGGNKRLTEVFSLLDEAIPYQEI